MDYRLSSVQNCEEYFFLNKVGSLGFSVIAAQNKKEISLKPFSYSHFDICRCLLDTIN